MSLSVSEIVTSALQWNGVASQSQQHSPVVIDYLPKTSSYNSKDDSISVQFIQQIILN